MNRIFKGSNTANMNKPLPEPLVDPDNGKTPIGELVIVPIQGRDLPNRERFGKQDPFVLFKLGNVSKRSSTDIRGGQRPRWKDDQINVLMYESDAKDAKSLYVTCLDEDPQKNDLIGDCVINLDKVLKDGEHDDWFQLSYKGREAGELQLQLTYYDFDPSHPLNKKGRSTETGKPGRRALHGTKILKPESKFVEVEEHEDDKGDVYQPPKVAETPVYQEPAPPAQTPMVGHNYPYAGHAAGHTAAGHTVGHPGASPMPGRPVSPAGTTGGHYVGHHTPQGGYPAGGHGANPNPYTSPTNGYQGYPAAQTSSPYSQDDPSKRLSFNGSQQPVAGGYPPSTQGGYPSFNQGGPPSHTGGGYPPANNLHAGGFPGANTNTNTNNNGNLGGYPGAGNVNSGGYPNAMNINSPYPQTQQLPMSSSPGSHGGPGGYPSSTGLHYSNTTNNVNSTTNNFGSNVGPSGPGGPMPGGYPSQSTPSSQGSIGGFPPSSNNSNNSNNNIGGYPPNNAGPNAGGYPPQQPSNNFGYGQKSLVGPNNGPMGYPPNNNFGNNTSSPGFPGGGPPSAYPASPYMNPTQVGGGGGFNNSANNLNHHRNTSAYGNGGATSSMYPQVQQQSTPVPSQGSALTALATSPTHSHASLSTSPAASSKPAMGMYNPDEF
ncbi:hypothetical protein DFQ26_003198 [Actinomortierella ambigua]|nr:hypothetical protein DFQ26_003198 [Actinomortierella ambigua]